MSEPTIQHQAGPSRGWYGLAAVIFIAGLGTFILTLILGIQKIATFGDSLQRVVVPGGGVVQLDKPGDYKLFYEPVSRVNGRTFNTPTPMPSMTMTVTRVSDGKSISLQSTTTSEAYNLGENYHGVSMSRFTVTRPGRFNVDATYQNQPGPDLVLAVGQLSVFTMLTGIFGIFGGAAAIIFGFIIALIICLVVFFKRKRAGEASSLH